VADNIILWAITMPGVSTLSGYIHNTYLHNKLFGTSLKASSQPAGTSTSTVLETKVPFMS